MSFSFTVGRLFRIPLRIHGLFLALVTVLLIQGARADRGRETLILLAILFGSVLLHELGHSLVARRFGARILDITLWPLGGLSRMANAELGPGRDAVVAVAGSATNLVLCLAAMALGGRVRLGPDVLGSWLDALTTVNAALALFNLAPAFPMDGGRALRAALSARMGHLRATEIAVRVGRWFTLAALVAALNVDGLFFPVAIVSVFLLVQGWVELQAARARAGLSPWTQLFRRLSPDAPEPPPAPPPVRRAGDGKENDVSGELERYRGTLDEFFRERERGEPR